MIAPLGPGQFIGENQIKPWMHKVSVCIPHLNTVEPLKVVIETILHQTEWPYIMIVDTGSPESVCKELEKLRRENIEIHYIRAHGYMNSSEPVAAAMDLAQTLCRTEYLFHTHSDVFLRRNDFFEYLLSIVNDRNPIAGYRMSPRNWITKDWKWMVGHTATMLHMPTIHKAGLSWGMQRMSAKFNILENTGIGWPDTETGFNYLLRDAGIVPIFLGDDQNFQRFTDNNIDHARSYAGTKVYNPQLFKKSQKWMDAAIREAQKRISLTIAEAKKQAKQHLPVLPNRPTRKFPSSHEPPVALHTPRLRVPRLRG